jgi:hypothetical protein
MRLRIRIIVFSVFLLLPGVRAGAQHSDVDRLTGALLGETPMIADLRELTDEIGGRPTGSHANLESVEWAVRKFRDAGVAVRKEGFSMPRLWLEKSCTATITGDVSFDVLVATMPFSAATPEDGTRTRLVDGGRGTDDDFARLGDAARGSFLLVATDELLDIAGLFREYNDAAAIEARAFAAGVAGVVYMSSRPDGILYRHNASRGFDNTHPLMVMERAAAQRAMRLLRAGKKIELHARIEIDAGPSYTSYNVIGEIPGTDAADEIVVMGAHLDSWGLGTGANDNGCNVVLMIDIARQMKRLGIQPRRTIRFVLWNGEEQGLIGSWRYTQDHADEMDRHVMAGSVDIGSGRILGFFTNGRPELMEPVRRALEPVDGLGPFTQIDVPVVGTDNYDFMMQGVANLVANHDSYNYGPTYHAASDTYDKVDVVQLRLNAAIVAAVTYGFADMDLDSKRHSRAQIQMLVDETNLGKDMRTFGLMSSWEDGSRGRTR